MRLQRAFTVPKVADVPNEDRCASAENVVALSDGASISYDPALWARIVSARYAASPGVTPEWLAGCIAEFSAHHLRADLSWNQQAAFDRGTFASLLGVRLADTEIHIDAVGDSIAVLCNDVERIGSFPYDTAEQFNQAPILLCTDPAKNPIFDGGALAAEWMCSWSLENLQLPRLLCMTDALGQWLFSAQGSDAVTRLVALETEEAFSQFVIAERESGRLKRDDTTLLAFW